MQSISSDPVLAVFTVVAVGVPLLVLGLVLALAGLAARQAWSARRPAPVAATADPATLPSASNDDLRTALEIRTHEALHDPLTSLGNRALLQQQGPGLLASSVANGTAAALLLFDLDRFKVVNDTLGHLAGDEILVRLGQRIRAVVRISDLAVRFGGDEFAVLAGGLRAPEDIEHLADAVLSVVAQPVLFEDVDLTVDASMGVAVLGVHGDTLGALVEEADRALYEAKRRGRGHWRQRPRAGAPDPNREAELAADLAQAIRSEKLAVHYQPQVAAGTGAPVGFEALARWTHPSRGPVQPRDFVALAEKHGLVRELTAAVIGRALADHRALHRLAPGTTVAVNLSPRSLLSQHLVGDVRRLLAEHRAPAGRLTLEITEPMTGFGPSIAGVLDALDRLGCRVSIADFGAERASVTTLGRFSALREVKLHTDLVAEVLTEPSARRVVRALVSMAHALDLRVVAPSVESDGEAAALVDLGCDVLQGFHSGGPATLDEISRWLTSRTAERHPAGEVHR